MRKTKLLLNKGKKFYFLHSKKFLSKFPKITSDKSIIEDVFKVPERFKNLKYNQILVMIWAEILLIMIFFQINEKNSFKAGKYNAFVHMFLFEYVFFSVSELSLDSVKANYVD